MDRELTMPRRVEVLKIRLQCDSALLDACADVIFDPANLRGDKPSKMFELASKLVIRYENLENIKRLLPLVPTLDTVPLLVAPGTEGSAGRQCFCCRRAAR